MQKNRETQICLLFFADFLYNPAGFLQSKQMFLNIYFYKILASHTPLSYFLCFLIFLLSSALHAYIIPGFSLNNYSFVAFVASSGSPIQNPLTQGSSPISQPQHLSCNLLHYVHLTGILPLISLHYTLNEIRFLPIY